MNINIIHPDECSLKAVQTAIDGNESIFRSPHVGNVNNNELRLITGAALLGASVCLEMVDTIRGDDSYSNPRVAQLSDNTITLASRNYAKSRIVGACRSAPDGISNLGSAGVELDLPDNATLKDIHLTALKLALPEIVRIHASTEYFAKIGAAAYELILGESAKVIDRPLRTVNTDGKILSVNPDNTDFSNIYGIGPQPEIGIIPPLEGMMAIEAISKAIECDGKDGRIVHIAGPDMIRYTREEAIMGPVGRIANNVLSSLGIAAGNIEYVVPCMRTLLDDEQFKPGVGVEVQSQYDILTAERTLA